MNALTPSVVTRSGVIYALGLTCLLTSMTATTFAAPAVNPVDTAGVTKPIAAVAPVAASPTPITPTVTLSSKPEWHQLTTAQQLALKPLMSNWVNISEGHKRKWLAISQNFAALPAAEQTRMHERMTEWAALSPAERSQARLNYAGVRELPADERLAKWQAYQALTPEQRQQLAATGGPTKPTGAAPAVKPVAPQKLTVVPTPVARLPGDTSAPLRSPKIAAAPHQVDHNTLLPQPVKVSAPLPVPQAVPVSEPSPTTAN